MKKYKVQIISTVVTTAVLTIITLCFISFFGVKESYYLSSEISFSNKNGIIDGYMIDYDDMKNEDENFELKIEIGSDEARVIDFEISLLMNYEQQYFRTAKSDKKVFSSVLSVNEDCKELDIILDRNDFELYQNRLVINIRQDIEELSYQNELVRDSNTVNYTFYVTNKDGKNQNKNQENMIKNIVKMPLEDTSQNIVFEIDAANNDNPLLKAKKNEDILINLAVGGNRKRQYIIWAYLNSRQVKINGNSYVNIEMDKNMKGSTNLKIDNKIKPGIYELEVYCVPSPFEEIGETLKEIVSAKRYTVKVE